MKKSTLWLAALALIISGMTIQASTEEDATDSHTVIESTTDEHENDMNHDVTDEEAEAIDQATEDSDHIVDVEEALEVSAHETDAEEAIEDSEHGTDTEEATEDSVTSEVAEAETAEEEK